MRPHVFCFCVFKNIGYEKVTTQIMRKVFWNSLTSWRPFPPFEKQLVEALADGKEVSAHLPPFEKQLVKALADGKEVFFFKFIPSAKKQETSQALETAQEDAQAILR